MDYEGNLEDMDYDSLYEDIYEDTDIDYAEDFKYSYAIENLWHDCLLPTISDGVSAVFHIFMCSLLLRFTATLGFLPAFFIHISSGALGLFCLHRLFAMDFLYVLAFGIIGYISIVMMHRIQIQYCGVVTAILSFLVLIICEIAIVDKVVWHKIRGSQMVLAMKLISLAFDVGCQEHQLPSVDKAFGYLYSVSTVAFGPWVSFSTYCKILQYPSKHVTWALRVLRSGLLGFVFLTVSTCWTSWFLQFTSWKWLVAYRDALSFRSSHYFICYISEALAVSSGMTSVSGSWAVPVVHPLTIEIPRSLVEVVISWNLPMHFWLKNYVFKTAKSLGNFSAVLLTYIASSLLHGLNFQLAAVLLSLGFYTYIEHVLRKKLADIFGACVMARKCKKDCDHQHKSFHPFVMATNIGFGALAMFHLAYLGVMFDSSSSSQEEGYSMEHTLSKWSELSFASHWVAVGTYVFYFLI